MLAQKYRHIFSAYPAFNKIQSHVLDSLLYSNASMVVSAPTGSGKTVILELAIVWLLNKIAELKFSRPFKIVYMAPVKALCAERFYDWQNKFASLGLNCQEITGDSMDTDLESLQNCDLVLTTPEKWDSLTRKWRQNKKLVQVVKLFLIDEVHLVNDENRGPTLEAVVSRMKTIQETIGNNQSAIQKGEEIPLRILAVSATIPNIEDIALWIGDSHLPSLYYKFGEEYRPVKLQTIVLGFPVNHNQSQYMFDMNLSYKLRDVLFKYSECKPTLVFCSTRKGVLHTVQILSKQITFHFNGEQKETLFIAANKLTDKKLREFLVTGVGSHHAGMDATDRRLMEDLFRKSLLPVMVTTSTLAMGVNLPAHLVVINSTKQYVAGIYQDYSEAQLLQMIGRAGRPQFDTTATAVIMTREEDKPRFMRLIDGRDILESSLHRHLGEHLNSEIVLETITDKMIAMNWIRSTFLYVRAMKNPSYYGLSNKLSGTEIEKKLQELVLKELNHLASAQLVNLMNNMHLQPTEAGKLMATFYMSTNTMKTMNTITGDESLQEVVEVIASCHEFIDFKLRRSEKRTLNNLNKCKGHECIRFPLKEVVKDDKMKVNVLIQAVLGCLPIHDHSLHQESIRIMRMGERVSKCLGKLLYRGNHYKSLLNAVVVAKCFYAKLWENSIYVTRQLKKIGNTYSSLLASAGKTSFKAIIDANPRDLERILRKPPPLGNELKTAVEHLPQYNVDVQLNNSQSQATITLNLINAEKINEYSTAGPHHWVTFLVGDSNNKILVKERFKDEFLLQLGSSHTWNIDIDLQVEEIHANLISDHWVGIDAHVDVMITKSTERQSKAALKNAINQYASKQGLGKINIGKKNCQTNLKVKKQKIPSIIEQIKMLTNKLPKMEIKLLSYTPKLIQTQLSNFLDTPVVSNKKLLNWKDFQNSTKQNGLNVHKENVKNDFLASEAIENKFQTDYVENTHSPVSGLNSRKVSSQYRINKEHHTFEKMQTGESMSKTLETSFKQIPDNDIMIAVNELVHKVPLTEISRVHDVKNSAQINSKCESKLSQFIPSTITNINEVKTHSGTKNKSLEQPVLLPCTSSAKITQQKNVKEFFPICKPQRATDFDKPMQETEYIEANKKSLFHTVFSSKETNFCLVPQKLQSIPVQNQKAENLVNEKQMHKCYYPLFFKAAEDNNTLNDFLFYKTTSVIAAECVSITEKKFEEPITERRENQSDSSRELRNKTQSIEGDHNVRMPRPIQEIECMFDLGIDNLLENIDCLEPPKFKNAYEGTQKSNLVTIPHKVVKSQIPPKIKSNNNDGLTKLLYGFNRNDSNVVNRRTNSDGSIYPNATSKTKLDSEIWNTSQRKPELTELLNHNKNQSAKEKSISIETHCHILQPEIKDVPCDEECDNPPSLPTTGQTPCEQFTSQEHQFHNNSFSKDTSLKWTCSQETFIGDCSYSNDSEDDSIEISPGIQRHQKHSLHLPHSQHNFNRYDIQEPNLQVHSEYVLPRGFQVERNETLARNRYFLEDDENYFPSNEKQCVPRMKTVHHDWQQDNLKNDQLEFHEEVNLKKQQSQIMYDNTYQETQTSCEDQNYGYGYHALQHSTCKPRQLLNTTNLLHHSERGVLLDNGERYNSKEIMDQSSLSRQSSNQGQCRTQPDKATNHKQYRHSDNELDLPYQELENNHLRPSKSKLYLLDHDCEFKNNLFNSKLQENDQSRPFRQSSNQGHCRTQADIATNHKQYRHSGNELDLPYQELEYNHLRPPKSKPYLLDHDYEFQNNLSGPKLQENYQSRPFRQSSNQGHCRPKADIATNHNQYRHSSNELDLPYQGLEYNHLRAPKSKPYLLEHDCEFKNNPSDSKLQEDEWKRYLNSKAHEGKFIQEGNSVFSNNKLGTSTLPEKSITKYRIKSDCPRENDLVHQPMNKQLQEQNEIERTQIDSKQYHQQSSESTDFPEASHSEKVHDLKEELHSHKGELNYKEQLLAIYTSQAVNRKSTGCTSQYFPNTSTRNREFEREEKPKETDMSMTKQKKLNLVAGTNSYGLPDYFNKAPLSLPRGEMFLYGHRKEQLNGERFSANLKRKRPF